MASHKRPSSSISSPKSVDIAVASASDVAVASAHASGMADSPPFAVPSGVPPSASGEVSAALPLKKKPKETIQTTLTTNIPNPKLKEIGHGHCRFHPFPQASIHYFG